MQMSNLISGSNSISSILSQLLASQQQTSAFQKADKDNNGTLDSGELQTFMELLSQASTPTADAGDLLAALDTSGDGTVDESEFAAGRETVQAMLNLSAPPPPPTGTSPFDQVDADASGTLESAEIQTLLDGISKTTGNSYTARDFITALDSNSDGVLSRSEFDSGREKAEALLGLPAVNGESTTTTASASAASRRSNLTDAVLANYLNSLTSDGGLKSLMSMLA
jgi:Ca2+-binding EF-hand superfamily protein